MATCEYKIADPGSSPGSRRQFKKYPGSVKQSVTEASKLVARIIRSAGPAGTWLQENQRGAE